MNNVLKDIRYIVKENVWLILSTFALILITHLTSDRLNGILTLLTPNIGEILNKRYLINQIFPNLKGMLYLTALITLSLPVMRSIYGIWPMLFKHRNKIRSINLAIIVFVFLFILQHHLGLRGMGEEYSQIAVDPFRQQSGWFNTRLLMPVIAHVLFFQGYWLYYIFFILLTIFFIAALNSWQTINSPLSILNFLSICTSSFIYNQFHAPGYPDILIYIFFLFIMLDEIPQKSKLYLLILSLFAHEASFFVGLVLAWRFLDRRHGLFYVFTLAVYFLTWIMLSQNGPRIILASHDVNELSGIEWVIQNPRLELLGIFFSYKILWAIILWAMIYAYRSKIYRDMVFISGVLGAGLLMTLLGVDTYRLLGYTFPMLLLSLKILEGKPTTQLDQNLLTIIFLLNLFLPSVYVGLNTGVVADTSMYGWFYREILSAGQLLP